MYRRPSVGPSRCGRQAEAPPRLGGGCSTGCTGARPACLWVSSGRAFSGMSSARFGMRSAHGIGLHTAAVNDKSPFCQGLGLFCLYHLRKNISEGALGADLENPWILTGMYKEPPPWGVAGVLRHMVGGCCGPIAHPRRCTRIAHCSLMPVRNNGCKVVAWLPQAPIRARGCSIDRLSKRRLPGGFVSEQVMTINHCSAGGVRPTFVWVRLNFARARPSLSCGRPTLGLVRPSLVWVRPFWGWTPAQLG